MQESSPVDLGDQKSMISMFRDATKSIFSDKHKDDTLVIIKSLVDNFKTVITALDKYLKSKDIDVSAKAQQATSKVKSYVIPAVSSLKEKGVMASIRDAKDKISTKLKDAFKSDEQKQGSPPDATPQAPTDPTAPTDNKESDTAKQTSIQEKLGSTLEAIKTKVSEFSDSAKKLADSQKENTTSLKTIAESAKGKATSLSETLKDRAKATYDKAKERVTKRQKEVQDEKDGLKPKDGKTGKQGFFGKLMGMLTAGIGGAIKLAFSGLTTVLTKVIGPLIGRAITGTLGFLIPKIIPGIASAIQGIAWAGTKAAAGLAWTGAKALVVGGAKLAAGAVTGAVSAVGLPAIAIGAAIAATAYGGYRLYKYLNRNEIGKAPFAKLTRLRLLMYGYSDTRKEHYHKLFELEMMMSEFTIAKKGSVKITPMSKKAKEDILNIFEVKRDDKEKYDILNKWFKERFMPAYTAFLSALSQVRDDVSLELMDKLNHDNIFRLVSVFRTPTSIFEVTNVPTFEQPKTDVLPKDVEDLLVAIRGIAKDLLPTDKSEDKNKADTKSAVEASKSAAQKAQVESKKPTVDNDKAQQLPKIQKEAQQPPGESDQTPQSSQPDNAQDKVPSGSTSTPPVATGPLQKGSSTLEGIKPVTSKAAIQAMDPNTLNLLSGMAKEYNTLTGKTIPVNSATRTVEEQQRLYQQNPQKAAKPGTSLHDVRYGLAADIDSKTADELDKLGLMKKYGFTRPIGGETWHIEPAGVSLNPALAKSDPVSRAKRVLSSPGRGGGGYGAEPGTPLGRRNMALQEKLFSAGTGQAIDPAKESGKTDIPSTATPPVLPTTQSTSPTPKPTQPAIQSSKSSVPPLESIGDKEEVFVGAEGEPKPKPVSNTEKPPRIQPDAGNQPTLDPRKQYVPPRNDNMDMGRVTDKTPTSPEQAVVKAAKTVGVNENTLLAFGKMESGLRPNVSHGQGSSAKGMFGFLGGTWKSVMAKYGDMYNVPPDAQPQDPYYSAVMAAAYAKDNLRAMGDVNSAGVREDTAMYLGHHFGPSGGKRIVTAYKTSPDVPVSQAVSPEAYNANRQELGDKTVKAYVGFLSGKIDKASGNQSPQQSTATPGYTPQQKSSYPATTEQSQNNVPESVRQERERQKSPYYKQPTQPPKINAASLPTPGTPQPTYRSPNTDLYDDEEYIDIPPGQPRQPNQPQVATPDYSPQITRPISTQNRPQFEAPPQQPNAALNLGPTERLLGGMSTTLISIKTLLEEIKNQGGMSGSPRENKASNSPSSPSYQPQVNAEVSADLPGMSGGAGGGAQALRVRSNFALSMSRKPQNYRS